MKKLTYILIFLFPVGLYAQSWELLNPKPTCNTLHSVFFPDQQVGYMAGYNTVIKTVDGGNSWDLVYNGPITAFLSIYFVSDTKGYGVGDSGVIVETKDGGVTWDSISSGTTSNLNSVYFT